MHLELRPTLKRPAARAARLALAAAPLLLAVGLGLAQSSLASNGAAAGPPAEAFGALPANTDVVLSPSGGRLAWVDHEHATRGYAVLQPQSAARPDSARPLSGPDTASGGV